MSPLGAFKHRVSGKEFVFPFSSSVSLFACQLVPFFIAIHIVQAQEGGDQEVNHPMSPLGAF